MGNLNPIATTKCEVIPSELEVLNELRKLPPCHKNNPRDVEKRIDTYFKVCAENQLTPTCEGLTLAIGITKQAINLWEHDNNSESGKLVLRAKSLINMLLTQKVVDGKLSPVYLIWAQKNWWGFSDSPQVIEIKQGGADSAIEERLANSNLVWDADSGDFIELD